MIRRNRVLKKVTFDNAQALRQRCGGQLAAGHRCDRGQLKQGARQGGVLAED